MALAGASIIYGAGMIESGVTFDCAQLVMDNEFAQMIKFVVNGICVDDELLMVDEIHKVGPFGDFLSLDSTYRHMRGAVAAQAARPARARGVAERRSDRPLHPLAGHGARDHRRPPA